MSRKVYIDLKVRLVINMEEGISVDEIVNNMDYVFTFSGKEADIVDTEIEDYEIVDSK